MNSANESKQKKTAQVVRTRPAGPDHQVVTIEGAEWVSSPALQRLPLAEGCRGRISTGSFRALGQHRIRHGAKHLCVPPVWCSKAGHLRRILLRGADHNLSVRLGYLKGVIDHDVKDGGLALHDGYREMAIANGVDPDHPALKQCR